MKMNWDQVEGNWKQMSGLLRKKWARLTGDDLNDAKGDRAILAGKLQEYYGLTREEAEHELDELIAEYPNEVATEGAPLDTETLKIGMKD